MSDNVSIRNFLLSDTYYLLTTNIVANQLRLKLRATGGDIAKQAVVWDKWIDNWSQFSLLTFLKNTQDGVFEFLDEDHQLSEAESSKLDKLIPWPEEAINAYTVFSYTIQLDTSLAFYLRDQLGEWWSPHMHRIEGGTSMLTEAFIAKRSLPHWEGGSIHLQEKITFNSTVNEIKYRAVDHDNPDKHTITVKGYYTSSGQPFKVRGHAVIITIPLHLVRQLKFVPKKNTTPPEQLTKIYKAIEDVWQGFATKIMIQCSDRFWEKQGIKGGFSKTNLPIGQVHYPTYDENAKSERGILMCYTWKSEALSFAALKPEVAIHEAVRQIEVIHPEIKYKYEVGAIQAWSNDVVGAFTFLKPNQFSSIRELMMYPVLNVMFFAGDGISFSTGWIQGALESGLRAAYQFYSGNEEAKAKPKK